MRSIIRNLRRRFGAAARGVSVRMALPWYIQVLWGLVLVGCGFLMAYWQYASGGASQLREQVSQLTMENRQLRTQSIRVESQKQVTQVAQKDLAKDMAALQGENVRLKEDLAFYKNILEDSSSVAVVKVHSFKVSKSVKPKEYHYRLLLVQSGRHDKSVQGKLQILLNGTQSGRAVQTSLSQSAGAQGFKINFKYYQPFEGSFTVTNGLLDPSLQAKFFQTGSSEPKLIQSVPLDP